MALLQVENLYKSFGNTEVLRGVSFSMERGEVVSLIGSSGGGKTTLLRCLNFLEKPDAGEIRIGGETTFSVDAETGKPVINAAAQKRMGMVFQQFNLFPQYSVMGNLTLAPFLSVRRAPDRKIKEEEIREKVRAVLAATGLSAKESAYPWQLSGGQQQRVAIARALMLEPDILCFDEPTSALDPELTGEVLKVIRDLRADRRTMIIVTHELDFARCVSDRVIFMANGVIEESGTPQELFDAPKSEKTRAFLNAGWKTF